MTNICAVSSTSERAFIVKILPAELQQLPTIFFKLKAVNHKVGHFQASVQAVAPKLQS